MIAGLETDEHDMGPRYHRDNPHYEAARLVAALSRFELTYLFQSFGQRVVDLVLNELDRILNPEDPLTPPPTELQRVTHMFRYFTSEGFRAQVLQWGRIEVRQPREAHESFAPSVKDTYWPFGQMLSLELFLLLNREPLQILFGKRLARPDKDGNVQLGKA